MKARWPLLVLLAPLAGCGGSRPATIAEVAPPPAPPPGPPLPAGATPGMLVPEPLADGSYPTPNQGLTGTAAVWHLRAGLNVAALSCPGVEGAAIRAGYNAWLKRDKAALGRVARAYAASYSIKVGAGSYDDAMTRLYNFFSQTPARPGLCAAAGGIVADLVTPTPLADAAPARLASLDQPFADFYRAYDAWRDGASGRPAATVVIAAAAVAPAAPVSFATAPAGKPAHVALTLDLSTLPADTVVKARR